MHLHSQTLLFSLSALLKFFSVTHEEDATQPQQMVCHTTDTNHYYNYIIHSSDVQTRFHLANHTKISTEFGT